MEKLLILVTTTVLGTIGWWIGEFIGLFTAFMLSIVGTAAGVYVGRRIAREHLP
jgi:uncharacterized membrane protein YfcA